jgi:pyochelin biosynthesis protein PchC
VTSDRWLRGYHPAAAGAPRLVCFPHAGGSASFFVPVSAALAPGVEVLAAQYPGRQDRYAEPGLTDVGALADALAAELRARPPARTAFFGHSMGAVVAYEVARRTAVDHLHVSGRRAPGDQRPEDDVHTRDDDGLLAEVAGLGAPGSELLADPELRELVLPALRADYTAVETYRWAPGDRLTCPVTALTGDRDPRVTPAEAQRWADVTTGPFTLRVFPGDHFYLSAQLPAVLDVLRPTLT